MTKVDASGIPISASSQPAIMAEMLEQIALESILSVNLTLETKALSEAGNRQNEEVKKIAAWAAILFAPTIVGTIYGMNFAHCLSWDG